MRREIPDHEALKRRPERIYVGGVVIYNYKVFLLKRSSEDLFEIFKQRIKTSYHSSLAHAVGDALGTFPGIDLIGFHTRLLDLVFNDENENLPGGGWGERNAIQLTILLDVKEADVSTPLRMLPGTKYGDWFGETELEQCTMHETDRMLVKKAFEVNGKRAFSPSSPLESSSEQVTSSDSNSSLSPPPIVEDPFELQTPDRLVRKKIGEMLDEYHGKEKQNQEKGMDGLQGEVHQEKKLEEGEILPVEVKKEQSNSEDELEGETCEDEKSEEGEIHNPEVTDWEKSYPSTPTPVCSPSRWLSEIDGPEFAGQEETYYEAQNGNALGWEHAR